MCWDRRMVGQENVVVGSLLERYGMCMFLVMYCVVSGRLIYSNLISLKIVIFLCCPPLTMCL